MNDKIIRISLAEKRKYCSIIKSGANNKTLKLLYKKKHKAELSRRTLCNWKRDIDEISGKTSTTKIDFNAGKKSEVIKKFEDEIRKKLLAEKQNFEREDL